MSISKEEMLTEIDYLEGVTLFPQSERIDAIRALILAVGEWQKRARCIRTMQGGTFQTSNDEIFAAGLIEDIRDFGEEKE